MTITALPLIVSLMVGPSISHTCPSGFVTTRNASGWSYTCDPFNQTTLNVLTGVYFGLVGADVHLTALMNDREANPIMRPIVKTPGGMGVKVALNAALAYVTYRYVPRHKRVATMAMLVGINGAVVAWNYRQYRQHYMGVR